MMLNAGRRALINSSSPIPNPGDEWINLYAKNICMNFKNGMKMNDAYLQAANDLAEPMQEQLIAATKAQPEEVKSVIMSKVLENCQDLAIKADEVLIRETKRTIN